VGWQLFKNEDRRELVTFLTENEWGHVAFSSRFKEAKSQSGQHTIYIWRDTEHEDEIRGALLHAAGGVLIPAFSGGCTTDTAQLRSLLFKKSSRRKIDTIMGLRRDVEILQRFSSSSLRASLVYHTMTQTSRPLSICNHSGLICKRGKPRDAGLLFPLQKAYELEEVLLDPGSFNSGACYINLQKNLRREIIYYALLNNKPVAKAGTNARGFTFVQLGGVYTALEVRNKGVAEHVLAVLLKEIYTTYAGVSLFVKKDNHAAIALYKKLNFQITDEFKIAYYKG
jgi:hypothetical protein